MALILNIETATPICSVALSQNGQLIALKETHESLKHASHLTNFIKNCLEMASVDMNDLDAIAVSKGPGSYTGLRIGLSTAKGICYALDKPLIFVDTLQSIAALTVEENNLVNAYYCPMIDARRMEVYCNLFDSRLNPIEHTKALVVEEGVFDTYFEQGRTIIFSGNGAAKCQSILNHSNTKFTTQEASAKGMVKLSQINYQKGVFEDVAYSEPFYLKAPNITTPKKRL